MVSFNVVVLVERVEMVNMDVEQVVDMLIAEGYARADVLTAYDSLIESGVEDEASALTAEEVQILRNQLDSAQAQFTAHEDI